MCVCVCVCVPVYCSVRAFVVYSYSIGVLVLVGVVFLHRDLVLRRFSGSEFLHTSLLLPVF